MRKHPATIRPEPPYLNTMSIGRDFPMDYAAAQKLLGVDEDLKQLRASMRERDQLKLDAIVETGIERLEHKREEQDWSRSRWVDLEIETISERLAKDGLSTTPDFIRKEAETNVAKFEQQELSVIKRETQVQLERHNDRALGPHRERTRTSRR